LNSDFFGSGIHPDAMQPEHLFAIASKGSIGAMAAPLGLIARYGKQHQTVNYIAKLNSKTDLVKDHDPMSEQLWTVDDALALKENDNLSICGVGFTVYLGSEYESVMLSHAAQMISAAHGHGLVTILWMYPRGKSIQDDRDPALLAGAAGVANALGSDFVKIKAPEDPAQLRQAVMAAGNTKLICAGGEQKKPEQFLHYLADQLKIGGTAGSATGRNIFQHSLPHAVALTKAIYALVIEGKTAEQAYALYQEQSR